MTELIVFTGKIEAFHSSNWTYIHDPVNNKLIISFTGATVNDSEQIDTNGQWSCVINDRHYPKVFINELNYSVTKGTLTIYK